VSGSAKATLSRCRVHDGKNVGVALVNKASATLLNNEICSNAEAGVHVQGVGSEAYLKGNHIHDEEMYGVVIIRNASAKLEGNTITGNDLAGVTVTNHCTVSLRENTITNNGHAKRQRTDEEMEGWHARAVDAYLAGEGFPGVAVVLYSTVSMPPGSNTLKGNGTSSVVEQIEVDNTSSHLLHISL
jgi:F-box protein 11